MPASIAPHALGRITRKARNRTPATWLIFTFFLNVRRGLDQKPLNVLGMSSNLSLLISRASIHPAAMAKAGEALNRNLLAEAAIYMLTAIHTTMNTR
ncbi:MAG: hypothetical protein A4E31_00555 [Methanomassiliicoccales archaeon PtaU1.Bin030]|nr:MAG: hypothetical protein A4E31_00555 [Methanomassiliicoccales archaeon PtaU1.Bin030]